MAMARRSLEPLIPRQRRDPQRQATPQSQSRAAQPAHYDAQSDLHRRTAADLLVLQRALGNHQMRKLVHDRAAASRVIWRAWSDADAGIYTAPKDPKEMVTPAGGWNAGNQTIGTVERIPLEGLKQGLQAGTTRSLTEIADEKGGETKEADGGKAIAVVPTVLKPGERVEILLHLHGHNVGYRERAKDGGKGMAPGSVRDLAADRVEQQIAAGGRNMIAILPQGTHESGFGAFDADACIAEVWSALVALGKLLPDAKRGAVVLSGHSGAASPINRMILKNTLPTGLGELVLFDAIHAGQRPAVEGLLKRRMGDDVEALKDIANPALNGGLDVGAVSAKQSAYLAGSFRFRGIHTPKVHPQKLDADNKKMWLDPETKKKPMPDESVWVGYGVEYEPLRDFIKKWIDVNTKGLDAALVATLRENYKVISAGAGASHNTIMGANDNLQNALSDLPRAAPAQAPPKTVTPKRIDRFLAQRQGASGGAPLTDAQQWDADWTAYPAQRAYFAGNDRPTGTPRARYDVLCPLYKSRGIARPMVYMATAIATAKFYGFSTPAHAGMAAALAAAEAALRAKGHATAPVTSVWALNARTTSTGAWSNHADGKAVDMDPKTNPHLDDKTRRKTISLVTGADMDKASQGYDVMKGASDRFRADYNPAGMQRRITELKAAETERQTTRDTVAFERDTLKGQRDSLAADRARFKQQLQSVPQGRHATADDVAKAAALKAALQQNQTNAKQVANELKQKELELRTKQSDLKQATKDRDLLEKERTKYVATDQLITDLEGAVGSLPQEIKAIDAQIAQSKQDERDAASAGDAAGVKAQRTLRAALQKSLAEKKITLRSKQTQLDQRKKARDADPLRHYAANGFLDLPKDLVEAMTAAGLTWGGNWGGAKDFMHFEL